MSACLVDHSEPVARKVHRCDCCHADIDAGVKYVRQRIVDGRDMCALKMHKDCYSTLMDYMQFHAYEADDPMPDWEWVLEWVAEGNMEPAS